MKYVYAHVNRPRLLASKLKAALASKGVSVSKATSYNLLARMVGHTDWNDLLSSIDPHNPSLDDRECPALERFDRLQFQVNGLVDAGVSREVAVAVAVRVAATCRPLELAETDFVGKDRAVYEDRQTPEWFQPGKASEEALKKLGSMAGPFLRNNPGGEPIVMTRQEVVDLIMEPEQGFKLPPGTEDEKSDGWISPDVDDMKPFSTPGWSREETEDYHNELLARGVARKWSVYSIRAKKRNEAGNWLAAPGRVLGKIVINKGLEMEGTVLRFLADFEICSYREAFSLEMVVTEKGMCAVHCETREPVYILKPDEG